MSLAVASLLYWQARGNRVALFCAVVFLALNWFGNSPDGTLARVRNRQKPHYGFYLDHVLDALGTFLLMSGLAFSGSMTPAVAYAFVIAYLLLSIESTSRPIQSVRSISLFGVSVPRNCVCFSRLAHWRRSGSPTRCCVCLRGSHELVSTEPVVLCLS